MGDRDQARRVVRVGDLVWTPPGEDHWHGASVRSVMTHLGLTLGDTHWHDEPVGDFVD